MSEAIVPGAPRATRGSAWRVPAVIAITIGCTLLTLALGQRIWVSPAGSALPPANLLPLFIALEAVGGIVFGLGVSFLVFGYGLVARSRQPLWLTYGTYLSIAWLMVSWWPHANLHRITPPGAWQQLLGIDYGFHLTLMVAALFCALFFIRTLQPRG